MNETGQLTASAEPEASGRPVSAQRTSSLQQVPQVLLILRPINEEWRMGEDWEVSRPMSSTMYDLRVMIEEVRGINRNRIMLRMKGRVFAPARDRWTLRRLGLYDGYIIHIEPTMSGSWWWHPLQHYIDDFIKYLEDFLDQQPEGGIFLSDMVPQITIPPPIKQSLRLFLRTHPEFFHIYCDTRNNTMWVRRTRGVVELPIFERFPHYLGRVKQFEYPNFDWDSYKDIDEKYVVDVFEEDPKESDTAVDEIDGDGDEEEEEVGDQEKEEEDEKSVELEDSLQEEGDEAV